MTGALSRGYKVRVMTKAEWQAHPDKMTYWGNDRWMPAIHQEKGSPIVVQFNG